MRCLGADAYELPTIRIEAVQERKDQEAFVEALAQVHHYDWIVFTSPNGVCHFFDAFYKIHRDARELGNVKIAAIGPGTAQKVEEYHFGVDLMPPKFVAESLLEELRKIGVENLKILLPRASGAREMLATQLEDLGAIVDDVPVYQTVGVTDDTAGGWKRFTEEGADLITFTSGSTVEHFKNNLEKKSIPLPVVTTLASIGPVTSAVIKDLGMTVGLEAKQHDIPGLVEAIVDYLGR